MSGCEGLGARDYGIGLRFASVEKNRKSFDFKGVGGGEEIDPFCD